MCTTHKQCFITLNIIIIHTICISTPDYKFNIRTYCNDNHLLHLFVNILYYKIIPTYLSYQTMEKINVQIFGLNINRYTIQSTNKTKNLY